MVSPMFSTLVLLAASLTVNAQSAALPLTPPTSATALNPALLSFSIEQDRWTDWAGTTTPNTFFFNALDNLKQRTGTASWVRIGADSEDHTDFSNSVQYSEAKFPASSASKAYPEASEIVVGDAYYQIASHLPSGTKIIWGVNFRSNNLTAATLEAAAIKKAFDSSAMKSAGVTLAQIEIGNEADGYSSARPGVTWDIAEYVKEWINFAGPVASSAGINASTSVRYQGCAFAGAFHTATRFSPEGMFANGILNSAPGKFMTSISQHHYSGSFCSGSGGLLQDLMTKATIRTNLTGLKGDISATHAQGLDYVLGETNSYACHGAPGVSNVGGAALWTLDYTLFASTLGISKVFFHMGVGYKYSLIQPVTLTKSPIDGSTLSSPLAPHVQPNYYGAIITTEAIGTTGSAKAVELSIDDTRLSGYAIFDGGKLKRAVLINSQAWLTTSTGTRPSKKVTFSFSGSGTKPTTMTVKRLAMAHADIEKGLTWGGQTYETSNARPSGTLNVQTFDVSAGVSITASEAVLLTFN